MAHLATSIHSAAARCRSRRGRRWLRAACCRSTWCCPRTNPISPASWGGCTCFLAGRARAGTWKPLLCGQRSSCPMLSAPSRQPAAAPLPAPASAAPPSVSDACPPLFPCAAACGPSGCSPSPRCAPASAPRPRRCAGGQEQRGPALLPGAYCSLHCRSCPAAASAAELWCISASGLAASAPPVRALAPGRRASQPLPDVCFCAAPAGRAQSAVPGRPAAQRGAALCVEVIPLYLHRRLRAHGGGWPRGCRGGMVVQGGWSWAWSGRTPACRVAQRSMHAGAALACGAGRCAEPPALACPPPPLLRRACMRGRDSSLASLALAAARRASSRAERHTCAASRV